VDFLLEKNPELAELKSDIGSTALHMASREGHSEVVRVLLKRGVDQTAVDKSGYTALHLATFYGKTQAAAVFFESGPNELVNRRVNSGHTPLHMAAQ
ncbi:ankyrin, partial [Morchella conica CCBAS932]